MKNTLINTFGSSFRSIISKSLMAVMAAVLSVYPSTTQASTGDDTPTMEIKIFKTTKPLSFRTIAKSEKTGKIYVIIRNEKGVTIYHEEYNNVMIYNRDFNFSEVADGKYQIEISNGSEDYHYDILVSTASGRVLKIK
jgi:outer membrane lipoprotein-sorting protein